MNLPRTIPDGLDVLAETTHHGGAGYSRIVYRSLFPNIDLLVYGTQDGIEYDWVVAPFADPSAIHFSFTGAERIRPDPRGDLVIRTSAGEVRHKKPRIYQDFRGSDGELAANSYWHGMAPSAST